MDFIKSGSTGFFEMVVEKIPKKPIVESSDMVDTFVFFRMVPSTL